jgi:integrase/recombinase XerD
MSVETGAEKRKGKKTIGVRGTTVNAQSTALASLQLSYTLTDAFDLYVRVKESENVKDRTKREYFVQFRYFTDWLGEFHSKANNVSDISTDMIREYIAYLAKDKPRFEGNPYASDDRKQGHGVSPYTVNIRIRFLKAFFNVLVAEGIIKRSPAENIKLMKVDEDTKEPLNEDDIRILLQQPDQRLFAQFRDYAMMLLMVDTGMRINEICSLEIQDIDFKSRCINLPAAKNKNRKMRIIPISNEVVRTLTEVIQEVRQHFDVTHVFVSNFGEPLNIDSFRKSLYNYARKARINKPVSPHAFRHFYAKQSALNGMDIFTLQRTLGHADISTTRKYVQLETEDLIRQHNLFSPLQRIIKRK